MAGHARRSRRSSNIWPGFVDALATVILVLMFVLLVFVMAQFFLGEALSGRDDALARVRTELAQMANLLNMERKANKELRADLGQLSEQLRASVEERDNLSTRLTELAGQSETLGADITRLEALKKELEDKIAKALDNAKSTEAKFLKEREISKSARAELALLNQQMSALAEQLDALQASLDRAEREAEEKDVRITSLGKRLNAALANKVQELARYRSEFFGKLREVLGERPDVSIVGDRFVFQSEVLFETAKADLGEEGKKQLSDLAKTLKEVADKIPPEINWVLRVDGHTDRVPIKNWRFPSNWELSTSRAVSVVKFLISEGIPADRLAATGFGAHHPLVSGKDKAANRRNRRIELKLTQR